MSNRSEPCSQNGRSARSNRRRNRCSMRSVRCHGVIRRPTRAPEQPEHAPPPRTDRREIRRFGRGGRSGRGRLPPPLHDEIDVERSDAGRRAPRAESVHMSDPLVEPADHLANHGLAGCRHRRFDHPVSLAPNGDGRRCDRHVLALNLGFDPPQLVVRPFEIVDGAAVTGQIVERSSTSTFVDLTLDP